MNVAPATPNCFSIDQFASTISGYKLDDFGWHQGRTLGFRRRTWAMVILMAGHLGKTPSWVCTELKRLKEADNRTPESSLFCSLAERCSRSA